MRSPRPTCWCRPQRLWGHSRGQGGRTGFCGARPGGGRIKGLYSASTGGTRLPRRRLSVPLQDNRARWAGPRAKGQPQSAHEADRGHHRVIRGRKEPGGRSRGTRAAEKGGARAEPGQPWVTGAGEPWSPGGPDPADPVRKEKDLGGAVAEGDERISYWTGVEGAGLERDQDGEAGLGGGQGAVQSHPRN